MSKQEIKCPHCQQIFEVDDTSYNNIVMQIRNHEFDDEVAKRLHDATESARLAAEKDSQMAINAKEQEINELKVEHQAELSQLREQLINAEAARKALESDKNNAVELAVKQAELENSKTLHQKESEISELKTKFDIMEKGYTDEIKRIKEFRDEQSTKMIGESLEQYCSNEFEKIRMSAFPNAEFGKDNTVSRSSGSKGDFIFRDFVGDIEAVSIMFECKNEAEETEQKQKNEKFFKELDKDRREKNCEYAILVSTLEKDNEVYNQGIRNVSHLYDKMFVVRPQFFIPVLCFLSNVGRQTIADKRRALEAEHEHIDLTNFVGNIKAFSLSFNKSMDDAHKRNAEAIQGIEKMIDGLEKIKKKLEASDKHWDTASRKLENLTVKKLTKNAPSVAEKLAAIEEAKELDDEPEELDGELTDD